MLTAYSKRWVASARGEYRLSLLPGFSVKNICKLQRSAVTEFYNTHRAARLGCLSTRHIKITIDRSICKLKALSTNYKATPGGETETNGGRTLSVGTAKHTSAVISQHKPQKKSHIARNTLGSYLEYNWAGKPEADLEELAFTLRTNKETNSKNSGFSGYFAYMDHRLVLSL